MFFIVLLYIALPLWLLSSKNVKKVRKKKKEVEVAAGEMHGYFASASKVHKHGKGRS